MQDATGFADLAPPGFLSWGTVATLCTFPAKLHILRRKAFVGAQGTSKPMKLIIISISFVITRASALFIMLYIRNKRGPLASYKEICTRCR